jgi:hypothetical protein
MSRPDPDDAIRKIVAELAALRADDKEAILDALNQDERQTIELFLREYAKLFDRSAAAFTEHDARPLSDWMRALLQRAAEKNSAMTEVARETLLKCAAASHTSARP